MLKLALNRVALDLELVPQTPLLVKDGDKAATLLEPQRPDLMFVRTLRGGVSTVYVPGASIKGVVRSAAERVLRTVGVSCCDPLDTSERWPCNRSASKLGDEIARRRDHGGDPDPMAPVYRALCHACRTFGSQALAGRISFADAYPTGPYDANQTERRSGVAIDRKTGGPSTGKLFEMEAVTQGTFATRITMVNLELWQLGLLGIVLREADAGLVRFGSAKTRGFGHLAVRPRNLELQQLAGKRVPAGVGAIREELVEPYGLVGAADSLDDVLGGEPLQTAAHLEGWSYSGPDCVWRLLDACAGAPWARLCSTGRPA